MADIKVIDFLKNVELNRKSLINSLRTANKMVDSKESLSDVIDKANDIILKSNSDVNTPSCEEIPEGYFEIRYVDIDGTMLKREIVRGGESTTPPPNPTYDSERLEFVRWCSAVGEKFDNIKSDLDYAPMYKTKIPFSVYLFLDIDESTGYTITPNLTFYGGYIRESNSTKSLPLYNNYSATVDWGDGIVESIEFSGTSNSKAMDKSHTYSANGKYIVSIILKPESELAQIAADRQHEVYISSGSDIFDKVPSGKTIKDFPIYRALKKYYCNYFTTGNEYSLDNGLFNGLEIFICDYTWNLITLSTMPSKVIILTQPLNFNSSNSLDFNIGPLTKYLIWEPSCTRITTSKPGFTDNLNIQKGLNYHLDKLILNGDAYNVDRASYTTQYSMTLPSGCTQLKKIILIGNFPLRIVSDSRNRNNKFFVELIMSDEQKEWPNVTPSDSYRFIVPYVSKNIYRTSDSLTTNKATLPSRNKIAYFRNSFEFELPQYSYTENIIIDSNYSRSINLRYWRKNKTPEILVYVLNQLKDLSQQSSLTITFDYDTAPVCNYYAKNNFGLYEICDKEDEGAMTILECFAQKNWTVTFTSN